MSLSVYLAFLFACVVLMIVPGPAVTLVVAHSLRHGRPAGLLNVTRELESAWSEAYTLLATTMKAAAATHREREASRDQRPMPVGPMLAAS